MRAGLVLLLAALAAGDNLAPNGDVEELADGYAARWSRGWCRDGEAFVSVEVSTDRPHGGDYCLHLEHTGERDWSLQPDRVLEVQPGDIFDLSVWVRIPGEGQVVLSAWVRPPDAKDDEVQWAAAAVTARGPVPEWRRLRSTLVIGPGMIQAMPRLIGVGPVEAYVDDFQVTARGNIEELRRDYAGPRTVQLAGERLTVELSPLDGALTVTDRRTSRRWRSAGSSAMLPLGAARDGDAALLRYTNVASGRDLAIGVALSR